MSKHKRPRVRIRKDSTSVQIALDRAKRVQEAIDARNAERERLRKHMESLKVKLRVHKGKADPERVEFLRMRAIRENVARAVALDREREEAAKAEARYRARKGAIRGRRGTYDDDPLQTDTWNRVVLDAGARPIGEGMFFSGGGLAPGEFVPVGEHIPEDMLTTDPNDPYASKTNMPYAVGGSFIRYGPGSTPGTTRPTNMPRDPLERGVIPTPAERWDAWSNKHSNGAEAKEIFRAIREGTE